ncbi:hypothetical protein MTO96_024243 [Rhipicephalus appendiculatus]
MSGGKGGGGRRASAAPQTGKDFSVNAKVTTGGPGHKGSTSQFLTVQVPVSVASKFMATQKLDAGELSARQSVSSLGSDEGPKTPTASRISRKPPPPSMPKAEEPERDDDPNMAAWESSIQRLTQMLRTLLQQLRSVSENTKINEPTAMVAAGVVGSGLPLVESSALPTAAPFQQIYAPPPQVMERSTEPVREHADLSVYFNKLASQMEALTQALKPYAGAPMANGTGSPAGQPMQFSAPASGGMGAGGLAQSDPTASLVSSVNQLSSHMTQVEDLFRRAMGARPLPKKREGLSISEEEDLRYCLSKLTDNMTKMSQDLKKTLNEHTVVPLSRLVDDLDEKSEDC